MTQKNILITGTSSGIGESIANHLKRRGHNVWGSSRNGAQETAAIDTLTLDVDRDESVTAAVEQFIDINGHIDVLINNAGFGLTGPAEETSIEEAKQQFETNFFGVVRMTNAVLPHMRNNGGGMILNISSIAGLIGLPFNSFYSASKFAVEGYVEALRLEVKNWDIVVANINPGDFDTGFTANGKTVQLQSGLYHTHMAKMLKLIEQDEQTGQDPIEVAKLVERIMDRNDNHKVRYLVGKPSQKLATYLKRVSPSQVFERVVAHTYDLKK